VLFVTHSIPEAVKIGSRILLLSPHPGRVRAELNSHGADTTGPDGKRLTQRIEELLFDESATQGGIAHE
jgi:NitT/TauT family transport system ATP-binding protein